MFKIIIDIIYKGCYNELCLMRQGVDMKLIKFCLPFVGFYDSILNREMERALDYDLDQLEEEQVKQCEALYYQGMDFKAAFREISHEYSQWLIEEYVDKANTQGWQVEKVVSEDVLLSPKEYNFSTDIVMFEGNASLLPSIDLIEAKHNGFTDKLKARIKEAFTSHDGFHSFTPNHIDTTLLTGDFRGVEEGHLTVYFEMLCELLWVLEEDDNTANVLAENFIDVIEGGGFFFNINALCNAKYDELWEIIRKHSPHVE